MLKGLAASGWHTAALSMRLILAIRPFGPQSLQHGRSGGHIGQQQVQSLDRVGQHDGDLRIGRFGDRITKFAQITRHGLAQLILLFNEQDRRLPGRDGDLPNGGIIQTYFDPVTKFPVLYLIHDQGGRLVEYDCYDRFQLGVRLDDDDFNPDKLWGKKNP